VLIIVYMKTELFAIVSRCIQTFFYDIVPLYQRVINGLTSKQHIFS